jgi:hypothetical protein
VKSRRRPARERMVTMGTMLSQQPKTALLNATFGRELVEDVNDRRGAGVQNHFGDPDRRFIGTTETASSRQMCAFHDGAGSR